MWVRTNERAAGAACLCAQRLFALMSTMHLPGIECPKLHGRKQGVAKVLGNAAEPRTHAAHDCEKHAPLYAMIDENLEPFFERGITETQQENLASNERFFKTPRPVACLITTIWWCRADH